MRGVLGALSAWGRTVVVSALVAGIAAAAVAVAWASSRETTVVTSVVRGQLEGIVLDAGDGSVEVLGGGERAGVQLRRRDEAAFGHTPDVERVVRNGMLRLRGRCPRGVLTSCKSSWRLVVPDNIPVTVVTDDGDVAMRGFRGSARLRTVSGHVTVRQFCGFALEARTETGAVDADATCPLARLSLRSRDGDVRAAVPTGRYRLDAVSDEGDETIDGITAADEAPFQVQALSTTGDVRVEGRR